MKRSSFIFLILAILISSVGVLSLFRPGFFLTDDGNSMVIRFSAFYEALRSGQFPVRFLSRLNYGFGYPVADFLYPLFMYIGVPIHAIGFSFVSTIRIILGLSFLSGTVFSYLWLRKLFDEKSALVGSVVYSLFPYHLFDIYKRGSVGEVLALGIIPFILWQIERQSVLWSAIGIGLLILAHNTLAFLFLPIVILYMLLNIYVSKNRKSLMCQYTGILVLGFGMSAFFWLPAIFDLQYTVFSETAVSDWSKYFSDFGLIGISTMIVILFIIVSILIGKIEIKKHRLTVLMLFTGVISIFFASGVSSSLWNLLPVSFIQFPFRLLSITIISTSFLAACLVSVMKGTNKIIVAILILVLTLLSSKEFLVPKVFQNYPDTFYSTNQDSTTVKNEYMPKWVKIVPFEMADSKAENLNGKEKVNVIEVTSSKILFGTFLTEPRTIQINRVYFPGWTAYVNGKEMNINYNNPRGLIHLNLPKGKNDVMILFQETPVRLMSDLISVISLIGIFIYFVNKKKVFNI